MEKIFVIETDKVYLEWTGPIASRAGSYLKANSPPGYLTISLRRSDAILGSKTWRSEVPPKVSDNPYLESGPRLYEETTYTIYLRSKNKETIELRHRNPIILRGLNKADEHTIYGNINFKGHIGRSRFTVLVNGKPEFDFEIEIFPSKLDYTTDYESIIADVQDISTALVIEYLQSTFQFGFPIRKDLSTKLEWLVLLRYAIEKLERGLRFIEKYPYRGFTRERVLTKSHRVRGSNTTTRKAIIQRKGSGPDLLTNTGVIVRRLVPVVRSYPTLDTPEHRWLALQLGRIRRRLAEIRSEEERRKIHERYQAGSIRDKKALEEISVLENRIAHLQEIEPIAAASGLPPSGFSSLTLQTAPGYREAYRACLILLLGLRVGGGPLELSVKDIHILYEYWCYLSILRIIAELLGKCVPVEQLLSIEQDGLRVRLRKGHKSIARFEVDDSRVIEVAYNPMFNGGGFVLPQQPDVVITLREAEWPIVRLVLDAKYRIETSEDYVKQFGSPGPPQDAINVLHRYRDAILEEMGSEGPRSERLKRSVVEGVALFPYVDEDDKFSKSLLWTSLEQLGIGAIPFLPNESRYVRKWLNSVLRRGGWTTAEQSIPPFAYEQLRKWKEAAKEIVLVAVLRSANPEQHLDWICKERCYYTPLTPTQRRQFFTRWIAIYSPASLRIPGAVTHVAPVEKIQVLKRNDISTPWQPSRDADKLQVVYRLGEVKLLKKVIENRGIDGTGKRFSQNRWTSRLALDRAKELTELFLETEPEWRLYEELRVLGVTFSLKPGRPVFRDKGGPIGRAWFVIDNIFVQYRGMAGFLIKHELYPSQYQPTLQATLDYIALISKKRC